MLTEGNEAQKSTAVTHIVWSGSSNEMVGSLLYNTSELTKVSRGKKGERVGIGEARKTKYLVICFHMAAYSRFLSHR